MKTKQQLREIEKGYTIIARLTKQRDLARRLAEQLRDESERPGGGHMRLPWEKRTPKK